MGRLHKVAELRIEISTWPAAAIAAVRLRVESVLAMMRTSFVGCVVVRPAWCINTRPAAFPMIRTGDGKNLSGYWALLLGFSAIFTTFLAVSPFDPARPAETTDAARSASPLRASCAQWI